MNRRTRYTTAVATAFLAVFATACGDNPANDGRDTVMPLGPLSADVGAPPNGTGACLGQHALDGGITEGISDIDQLNCTSQDVDIAFAEVSRYFVYTNIGEVPADMNNWPTLNPGETIGCLPGQRIKVETDAKIQNNAQERYDLGLWINDDPTEFEIGGVPGAQVGAECLHYNLIPGQGNSVSLDAGGADLCGDVAAGVLLNVPLDVLDLACEDPDGDGSVDISACAAWRNGTTGSQDIYCPLGESPYDPIDYMLGTTPTNKAKCKCSGLGLPIEIQAQLTVVKVTVPSPDPTEPDQEFDFTSNAPGLSSFSLSNGESASTGPISPNDDPGDTPFNVSETVPTGWDLTSATCDNGDAPSAITLTDGDDVTCTFTNTKRGSITIIKDAVPDDPQDFSYTSTASTDTPIGSFSLDDDPGSSPGVMPNSRTFDNLKAGTYSVTETAVTGWDLTDLTCTTGGAQDGTAPNKANITLPAGGSVTCTFTNTKRGSITIIKDAVPDDPQDFGFTSTSGPDTPIGAFSLDDDADATLPNTRTFNNLKPGTYTVTETLVANWDLTDLTCTTGGAQNGTNPTADITLPPGGSVTCTFTNSRKPRLIVTKTILGGGTQLFDFTRNPGSATFSLTDGGSSDTGFTLDPGTYRVCELDLAVAWSATATVSIAPATPTAATLVNPNFPEDLGNRCVDVTLAYTDVATIAWTNDPPPEGDARTIGYWKNWSSCSNGKQYEKATERGMLGWTLDGNLPQTVGILNVTDCETGVAILDKRDVNSNRKRANDAAYNLASQLLAYYLNQSAGAYSCAAAASAASAGQSLLASEGFDGAGQFLRPRDGDAYDDANDYAEILDMYNNNTLSCGG